MKRNIQVFIGNEAEPVGILHYDEQGARERSSFEYDPSWLSSPRRFALDPSLPIVVGPQYHGKSRLGSVFHPVFADTEPDGWARRVIMRDHVKHRNAGRQHDAGHRQLLNSLDYLLSVDDISRVGALRFKDESGQFQRRHEEGRHTIPPLIELGRLLSATRAFETDCDTPDDLEFLRGRATSLGGLRPKCSIIDDRGNLSIGKFPSISDTRAVTKGEVLALQLARLAGINAAESSLIVSEGVPVALIKRFDRNDRGDRLMYASAATMFGEDGDDGPEHAYTELVDILRTCGADVASDIEELWRRMAFYILITNIDDHLRNHGFLHVSRGSWRLSPAFDINPFPDRVRTLKTWLSEDMGPDGTIEGLMSVIAYFRISLARAKEILHQVEEAVSRWRVVGRTIGMTEIDLESFSDAFEHPERSAARKTCRT